MTTTYIPTTGRRVRRSSGARHSLRRAFNLVELTIALAITGALLAAVMVALDASFKAYQQTTEEASTHTIGRLAMHRMLTMIRTGSDFGPFPVNPNTAIVRSNFIDFVTPEGEIMTIEWDEDAEELLITITDGSDETSYALLGGVIEQLDGDGDPVPPFTLEYERGRDLYRATIDLMVVPDDNMDVQLDGENTGIIRLVASAMPRTAAFEE